MRHNRTLSAGVERGRAHRRAPQGPGRWAALAILMALGAVAAGSAAGGSTVPRARLSAITAQANAKGTSVLIEASEPVAYATTRPDPLTVLIDLRHATTAGAINRLAASPVGAVAAVTLEDAQASDGAPVARVRLLLASPAVPEVHSDRNTIRVDVADESTAAADDQAATAQAKPAATKTPAARPAAAVPAAKAPAAPPAAVAEKTAAAPAPAKAAAARIEAVRASEGPGGVEVTIEGNAPLTPSHTEMTKERPHRLVLDFAGVASSAPASTRVGKAPVERVRVAANSLKPLVTRVVLDLSAAASYRVQAEGNSLKVVLGEGAGASAAATQPTGTQRKPAVVAAKNAEPKATPVKHAAPVRHAPSAAAAPAAATVPEKAPEKTADPVPAQQPPAQAPAPKPAPPAVQAPPSQLPPGMQGVSLGQPAGGRQYSGHPISLDFQGADLRSVLRIFSVDTGLNIVIDPSVQGSVDVALRDVPWDQALDIILRANKLGWVADGTIIRVAPLTVLAEEESQRRKLADEQALAGELKVMTHTLSYAKADDVKSLLNSALTKRGEVQVDTRTNTVIIRDLPTGIDTARTLLTSLDRPQPQVEIEARIVQTSRDFSRKIGVQWGFNGNMTPNYANTTNLSFPNSISGSGRTGSGSAVDLAVPGATSAVGLALGSINGAFNLDLALSAMESQGKGRILSTPRVSTQNNMEAEMMQGQQIPIQTVANNTVTVQFKDAALTLKVTPQITASNTVIMRITLENASADWSRAVGEKAIPPIDTQRAITTVLVKDGETTVIGGIYVSQEQATNEKTPALSRIPLLGWLFKRDALTDSSRELLIFITPRIAKL